MKKQLAGSLVLHLIAGAVLVSIHASEGDPTSATDRETIAIEIVAPTREAPPPVRDDVMSGGASIVKAGDAGEARRETPRQARAKARAANESPLGEIAIDRRDDQCIGTCGVADIAGDGGEGRGTGGNRGDGIGFGDGGSIAVAEDQIVLPEAPTGDVPPPSKARPAKLIYPKRERDMGEEKLFVARITVDTDGYVVGARLVKGRNGPADSEAADLIFRFRYLPALDDVGRAVKSTFEQPFHVNR